MEFASTVINGGGSPVFERGVVYSDVSTTPDPTNPSHQTAIAMSAGVGGFSVSISGLTPNTTYYFRGYARNDLGYGFSGVTSQITTLAELPTVTTQDANTEQIEEAQLFGDITYDGNTAITEHGFDVSLSETMNPSFLLVELGAGAQGSYTDTLTISDVAPFTDYYYQAFATNSVGTVRGVVKPFRTFICLAEGTLCRLADGTDKAIQDITYQDDLRVWNFDLGCFDVANPRWIKRAESTRQMNQLTFSDGSELFTIGDHRIFNQQAGQFTPAMSDETPLGTSTFNVDGELVTLVAKAIIEKHVAYYNVITDSHINLFANGLLTSCRLNNLYPIENMHFVKDDRIAKTIDQFKDISVGLFKGLRLAEQPMPVDQLQAYVERLMAFEKNNSAAMTIWAKRSNKHVSM